ncbi:universal stress protein [Brachybacterium sacelli]|uniref:Nucleotide-binding universal stress UspA family protein n=1 Tax=Brachybacterium sacelli TaxID=173364 RepID=A0ABS4X6Q8_9MICO|nr:universal stress protein [Brachybacterium sacelli]MBP2384165.1 nucleotide-binding universal stress UspA family protein [Brachybacterium sacelli]
MTILIAYAPTPVGDAAVTLGIEQARLRGEDLLIVNSRREGVAVDQSTATEADRDRLREQVRAAGVELELHRLHHGDNLAEAILALAAEREVSLIVIGVRNRTQVGKFIMGSTAQRILLQADRPVLAAKFPA